MKKKLGAIFVLIATTLFFLWLLFPKAQLLKPKVELSAWLVDWQWEEGCEDAARLSKSLQSLSIFAASFNPEGRMLLPSRLRERIEELEGASEELFLVLVNDTIYPDGRTVQKDPQLLKKLIGTPQLREKHKDEIIGLLVGWDLIGIELDYENIPADLWPDYLTFCQELYQDLKKRDKKLKVVLEVKSPLEEGELPQGPEYTMMVYNLYGPHSGAGPKADQALIEHVVNKLKQVPGKAALAFATGGFAWRADGTVKSLTEKEAVALSCKAKGPIRRDPQSGSLTFKYLENGAEVEVWYGDDITIRRWIELAQKSGYHQINLWRLGALQETTLEYLEQKGRSGIGGLFP